MTTVHASPAKYLWVWVWLASLMLLGVFFSRLPVSTQIIALLVLLLSTIKAMLVVLYYMHLKFDRRWLALVAAFPLVLIALATLVVLSSWFVKL